MFIEQNICERYKRNRSKYTKNAVVIDGKYCMVSFDVKV